MPFVTTNGVTLSYQSDGAGDPVLLIMGSSAAGHVWTIHQTPALHRAGYRTVIFHNRGIPPSSVPPGDYTLEELATDTAGLIETLDLGPCHIVGTSLGAIVAQEVAIRWPHLVRSAVLIATRARTDVLRAKMSLADKALRESGIALPAPYRAARTALEMLSPATLNDEEAVGNWLDIFELSGGQDVAVGQEAVIDNLGDRRPALGRITVPCRAIAFSDDLICPPHLVAETAEAIPGCDLVQIDGCGHIGYLERPDEVNGAILEFLQKY
ncbi:alpha/beta hydrolase [Micromonospora sp. NBC_01699]|uniref:alpha/beta fold hydrolase n=1 Tax=Micromonospora sp. NBC_01699 TaxID=2975984 RepID=UPI002E2C976C|nr:alpha/beta fold hydrolase [Micromonospora sp. NBC_01699]